MEFYLCLNKNINKMYKLNKIKINVILCIHINNKYNVIFLIGTILNSKMFSNILNSKEL